MLSHICWLKGRKKGRREGGKKGGKKRQKERERKEEEEREVECGGEGETGGGKTEGKKGREKEEEEEVGEEEEGRKYLRHAEITGKRELSPLNSREASRRGDEGVSSQKSERSFLNR